MTVDYYMVTNCSMETIDGRRMLLAPPGTDRRLLHEYGFHPLGNGRMFRLLSEQEYDFILHQAQNQAPGEPVRFIQTEQERIDILTAMKNQRIGNRLCIISVLLLCLRVTLFLFGKGIAQSIGIDTKTASLVPYLGGILDLAAWILLIIARVRFPENRIAGTLLPKYGYIYGTALFLWLLTQMICAQCASEWNSSCGCHGCQI